METPEQVSERLRELSAQLNKRFEIVEGELKKLNFGVPYWTHVDSRSGVQLGYDKISTFTGGAGPGCEWGLYIKCGVGEVWRAIRAPRKYRLMVLPVLDTIIDSVQTEALGLVRKIEEALESNT